MSYGNWASGGIMSRRHWRKEDRRSDCPVSFETNLLFRKKQVLGGKGLGGPGPDAQAAPILWSPNATASAYVGWDGLKIGKRVSSGKCRDRFYMNNRLATHRSQNGFTTARITIPIMRIVGTSLI